MKRAIVSIAILLAVGFGCAPDERSEKAVWPTEAWDLAAPESGGFDSGKLADALLAMRSTQLAIHSLLIVRRGKILTDAVFYPFDGRTVHNTASVTKSVMTTLIAIAAEQGKLTLDQPMLSFFPGRTIAHRDLSKERVTVRHLTEMASGLDCVAEPDEPTLHQMNASPDWIQFTLDLKMVAEPGTTFSYCSPGMHLLSAILQQATGQTAFEFARENLFAPLGIKKAIWPSDPQGVTRGWGDLHLRPRDMAKIGYLWLHDGAWEGKQIVPADWVAKSSRSQIKTGRSDDYGYGWWIMTGEDLPQYAAEGRGGQRVSVFPTLDAVIVTTGGGLDPGDAFELIAAALVDPEKAAAPNPAGETRLRAAVTTLTEPPPTRNVAPLPDIAVTVTGRTYSFEKNPLDLSSLRINFDGSAEALLSLNLIDQPIRVGKIGLDGVYRWSKGENDLPVGIRGHWADAATFLVEYDTVASIDAFDLKLRFDGDRVVMDAKDRTYQSGVTVIGRVKPTHD